MNELTQTFESIKHIDDQGNEFWSARELYLLLDYSEWRNFTKVIDKAMKACESSHIKVSSHFVEANKMVQLGVGTQRQVSDFLLSRYACYLIVQNGELITFDIVTANPPFSLDKWGYDEVSQDRFQRFERGLPPKTKGDYAFISHMIKTLKEKTGRMGVVVPHGVLFRGAAEGKIRQKLIDENLLDAVIGLPEKLFYGTGIPAAILIFRKNKTDDSVLFIDASNEFKPGKNQNTLTAENIEKIVRTYRTRQAVEKYAFVATLADIQQNDYNLNIPRYVDTFEEEQLIDLHQVRTERMQLKQQLAELETKMEGYLRELGY